LLIRLGRENVALDPTATVGQEPGVIVPASREEETNTAAQVLTSRHLVERTVDALGVDYVLGDSGRTDSGPTAKVPGWLEAAKGRLGEWLVEARLRTPLPKRDRAILSVQRSLSVEPVRKSNVMVARLDSHSPEAARTILSELIEEFLAQNVRLHRSQQAHAFLAEQAASSGETLQEAERELRDMKEETGLVAPDEQRQLVAGQVAGLKDELAATAREMAGSKASIEKLAQALGSIPRTVTAEEIDGALNQGTDMMRQQFYALQLQQEGVLAKYTDSHPLAGPLRQQRDAAAEILLREDPKRRETRQGINPAHQEAELALLTERSALAGLEQEEIMLRDQLAQAEKELRELNENDFRIAELQRKVDLCDSVYRKYVANLEQARIDESLQAEKISNISVAQPASYLVKPVRPRVLTNLAMGLVVGLLGGLLLAFASDRFDHSLRTPEDIEANLDLPTLVAIPRLRSRDLPLSGRN
jgi:uncharacterized protein involved in exopolysaccharide biosynthesis